jgi:putative membrane protein
VTDSASEPGTDARIFALQRPHKNLLVLYAIQAGLTLVFFPFVFPPLFFRYITLRYGFDAEGVNVSWGILFRREVYLTYRRIQDIHVKRNVIERWLEIGTVEVQTASGSSKAELAVEGVVDYELVRDFLYRRMRGFESDVAPEGPAEAPGEIGSESRVLELLHAIRAELEATRAALEERR